MRHDRPVVGSAVVHLTLTVAMLVGVICKTAQADVEADMQTAAGQLEAVVQNSGPLMAEGQVAEFDKRLLAVFPKQTRTPVQTLVLANSMFQHDPVTSYALHKQAALALPNEEAAQLEWALEQHRAGEFDQAGKTYEVLIKAYPTFGPLLGMWAECLIQTGHIHEAADAWTRSEAGGGSVEMLESWVCDVHSHATVDRDRAVLYAKAKGGDSEAAVRLVALDCKLEHDWWNNGPNAEYLAKDIELLHATTFAATDAEIVREAICAARCGVILAKGEGGAGGVLRNAGYLLDDHATLPHDGRLLSTMQAAAESSRALTVEQARARIGPAILAQAKATKDAETFNVAAHLYVGTDQLPEIDQLGWDATGDSRFAASLIFGLYSNGTLSLDDARLIRATKQFPNDATIAFVVVMLTRGAGKLTQAVLVNAIEAEYSHFSNAGGLEGRPSAIALRVDFAELAKLFNVKPATTQ